MNAYDIKRNNTEISRLRRNEKDEKCLGVLN